MKYLQLFLIILFFSLPTFSEAQLTDLGQFNQDLTLTTIPNYPQPLTETKVSADAYTFDTVGANFYWYVDGEELPNSRNQREITLTTKGLGERTTVELKLELASGQIISETIAIVPAEINLTIEADTITPAFYQGRPLPTIGSTVRFVATPNTINNAAAHQYTYIWKHDNKVLFGGPATGKFVADIEMGMGKEQLITVDAILNNVVVARKSIVIEMSEPEILFYEENPLRGASEIAATSPYMITNNETNFRAEPYYMSRSILNSDSLLEWEIDRRRVDNPNTDPQFITLNLNDASGQSLLNFHVRNLQQLLQGVEESLVIQY